MKQELTAEAGHGAQPAERIVYPESARFPFGAVVKISQQ